MPQLSVLLYSAAVRAWQLVLCVIVASIVNLISMKTYQATFWRLFIVLNKQAEFVVNDSTRDRIAGDGMQA